MKPRLKDAGHERAAILDTRADRFFILENQRRDRRRCPTLEGITDCTRSESIGQPCAGFP